MNTYKLSSNSQACGEQVASKVQPQPQYQQLKLALDVQAASIVVVRMLDGAKPQPPQTFKPAAFLTWVHKQQALAQEVVSCYEAGPTGFWLHRKLTGLGVRNYVVCPTRLDERYRGVANDGTTPPNWPRGWIGIWRAMTRRWRWCACPPRPKSKSGHTNGNGNNCGSSG